MNDPHGWLPWQLLDKASMKFYPKLWPILNTELIPKLYPTFSLKLFTKYPRKDPKIVHKIITEILKRCPLNCSQGSKLTIALTPKFPLKLPTKKTKKRPQTCHQNITEIPKMSQKNQNIVELQGRRNAIDFDIVFSSISKDAKLLMDPVQSKPGIRKSFWIDIFKN